ncbi:MAG: glycosyltransferase family 9 protein [bacterium]|nr:glycosyltransferase family 9 protein [bacterium]
MPVQPHNYRSVLCLCLSGIGDALTFTPFVQALHAARPELVIDVLVMFKSAAALFHTNPAVQDVLFVDFLNQPGWRSLREMLAVRQRNYDAVVAALPANRWEYNLIQVLAGGRRIGHRYLHCDRINLNFLKQDAVCEDDQLHVVEKNLQLLPFLGVPVPAQPAGLLMAITADDRCVADAWLQTRTLGQRRLIGLHPGSAMFKNHINKRWPAAEFAALAARCVDELDADLLVFGEPAEQALKERIVQQAARPARVHAVDHTTLRQSAALIARCAVMVTNDSALMHVAAAMHTPVVAIFAYTNPRGLYPWQVPHRIVRHDLPCSPCFYYSPKPAGCRVRLDYACIRHITVREVFAAVLDLLNAPRAEGNADHPAVDGTPSSRIG